MTIFITVIITILAVQCINFIGACICDNGHEDKFCYIACPIPLLIGYGLQQLIEAIRIAHTRKHFVKGAIWQSEHSFPRPCYIRKKDLDKIIIAESKETAEAPCITIIKRGKEIDSWASKDEIADFTEERYRQFLK